jgi:hypothetical protein
MTGSINIDDAATPGADSGTWALPESRYSWAGVIIPDDIAQNVHKTLEIFTTGIASDYGAHELHFTDIYSRRGPYSNVTPEQRIEIFELMFTLFESFDLPVLYQTCSKEMLTEWSIPNTKKGIWWDQQDIKKMGLLFLCFRINKFMQEHSKYFPSAIPAFIDEGLASEGNVIKLPNWPNSFKHQKLNFVKSHNRLEIQLADFAAFCIARSQWLQAKPSPNKGDIFFIKNATRINAINLNYSVVDEDKVGRSLYEWKIMSDRKEKGFPRKYPKISK